MTKIIDKILFRLYKYGVLKHFNFSRPLSLNGVKFKIPVLENVGLANLFMSERWMIDVLDIVLSVENKLFIDVGVNIGQTLLKLRSVSNDIPYVGFEPNPLCVNYVLQLIKKNRFENITIIPVGISDKTELVELTFFSESGTDSSASIIQNFRPGQKINRKEYIPVFNIDKIKEKIDLKNLSVLKIDVEGAELEVIKSFYDLISITKPIILMEILPVYNDENKDRLDRQVIIQDMFRSLHYLIYRVKKSNEALSGIEEIDEIGIHADLNACEYVMVPNNKNEKLLSAFNKFSSRN